MTKTEIVRRCMAVVAMMAKNYHYTMHPNGKAWGFLICEEEYCTEARRIMREMKEYE